MSNTDNFRARKKQLLKLIIEVMNRIGFEDLYHNADLTIRIRDGKVVKPIEVHEKLDD